MISLEKNTRYCFYSSVVVMVMFLIIKLLVVFNFLPLCNSVMFAELICFVLFIPLFFKIIYDYVKKNKESVKLNYYARSLNETLISQTHNHLFYEGNVNEGAKLLTKEVTNSICADRCSIWLYNKKNNGIICEQLYEKKDDEWFQGVEIFEKDFKPYFDELKTNPIIIANDVDLHPATSCFKETYSGPLGIRAMLDVPIIYKGEVIGVICIESYTVREWHKVEVNFAEMLSSLYSFAYSVEEGNELKNELSEFEHFVDSSVLVSKADKRGKITYVNKKFEEVSGWSLEECLGKDHRIVNSNIHDKKYWSNMYKTVKSGKIWNDLVINKNKDGELYWVDTYIKADFDTDTGKLKGYTSIRQDVTEIHKNIAEINKKNTYLEHAAKILRHDMHSGINTYIPRGISSLERRLKPEDIETLKLEAPLKMLKEGLKHTQKVYKGVYEFTNLVKEDVVLTKETHNLKDVLNAYLSSTAYSSQVAIDWLPTIEINESLFCTAIDNLIRNGLKYNDSDAKMVAIFMENEENIAIQDNGRGMTQEEFEHLSLPYNRKDGQKESGTGLGLNICIAILHEHGFTIKCEKNEVGTKLTIKIK
jgi:chemotaxis family two-component system sensor kinase Cph1